MSTPRYSHSMAEVGSHLYIVGGRGSWNPLTNVEVFELDVEGNLSQSRKSVVNLPQTLGNISCWSFQKQLYVVGTFENFSNNRTLLKYNDVKKKWVRCKADMSEDFNTYNCVLFKIPHNQLTYK